MKFLSLLSFSSLSLLLLSCSSGSGAAAPENTSSANASSSDNIPTYSSSSSPLQSNCPLAQNLPAWSGTTPLIWVQNVGNSCYASNAASLADITNYENALHLASWNSPAGWIITTTVSAITYTKPKNLDSTLTFIIAEDVAMHRFSYSLSLSQTTYAQPIDRVIASLPPWNGSSKLVWGDGGNSNVTVPMQISSQEIASYTALLVADGWVSKSTPFEEEISRFEKSCDGKVYTFAFKKDSSGLIYLHLMDLY